MALCIPKVLSTLIFFTSLVNSSCKSLNSADQLNYYQTSASEPAAGYVASIETSNNDSSGESFLELYKTSYEDKNEKGSHNNSDNVDVEQLQLLNEFTSPIVRIQDDKIIANPNTKTLVLNPVEIGEDMETAHTLFLPFFVGLPRPGGGVRKGCKFRRRRGRRFGGGWLMCDSNA